MGGGNGHEGGKDQGRRECGRREGVVAEVRGEKKGRVRGREGAQVTTNRLVEAEEEERAPNVLALRP